MDMSSLKIPRILGEINDKDTEFTAALKKYQELLLVGGLVVIVSFVYAGFQTFSGDGRSGTWRYGLCRLFLEEYVDYPDSLKILDAGEKQTAARIRYLVMSSYGGYRSEVMECFYDATPEGIMLSRVRVDRKSLSLSRPNDTEVTTDDVPAGAKIDYNSINGLYQDTAKLWTTGDVSKIYIDEFNKVLPAMMATGTLDTEMPSAMPDSIEELKYN